MFNIILLYRFVTDFPVPGNEFPRFSDCWKKVCWIFRSTEKYFGSLTTVELNDLMLNVAKIAAEMEL